MNFRTVRRNIYLCLEQITRDANCRVSFHDVELFRRFIKRGGLLLAANLCAEVAIELHPHNLPGARTCISRLRKKLKTNNYEKKKRRDGTGKNEIS